MEQPKESKSAQQHKFELLLGKRKGLLKELKAIGNTEGAQRIQEDLDGVDKELAALQAELGTYKSCPRCHSNLVWPLVAGGLKSAAGQRAYWCKECNLSWRSDGTAIVEGLAEVKNIFSGATEGRNFLRDVLEKGGSEPLSLEMLAILEGLIAEHDINVWFNGFKSGQLALLEHKNHLEKTHVHGKAGTRQGDPDIQPAEARERNPSRAEQTRKDGIRQAESDRGTQGDPNKAGLACQRVSGVPVWFSRGTDISSADWEKLALYIYDNTRTGETEVLECTLKENKVLEMDIRKKVVLGV